MDRPEASRIVTSIFYWGVCFILIPFMVTVVLVGSYEKLTTVTWFGIGGHVLNFAVVLGIFLPYLKDSFLGVQINRRGFVVTALITAALMVGISVAGLELGFANEYRYLMSAYPVSETTVISWGGVLVGASPLWGTLCMTLVVPLTVSCMFYATVFAPICTRRPVLAYIIMALLLMIPRVFNGWWLDRWEQELVIYLAHLPIHLLGCWSYQKTDTVWTPIAALALSNLLMSGLFVLLIAVGVLRIA